MADIVDMAAEIEQEHLARAIARARSIEIPAGVPGECTECGEHMPRLVDGSCAPCRDGRTFRITMVMSERPAVAVEDCGRRFRRIMFVPAGADT